MWSKRSLPLAAVVALGLALLLTGPVAVANGGIAFRTQSANIVCFASVGAHGSGIDCSRVADGAQATVQWSGAYLPRTRYSPTVVPRRILPPGRTRRIRMVDVTYACTAWKSALRCKNQQGRGFLLSETTRLLLRKRTVSPVRRCPDSRAGLAYFSQVGVRAVGCVKARRLLANTTLARVRRDRERWSYGGLTWTLAKRGEATASIIGRRGSKLVRATWSTI